MSTNVEWALVFLLPTKTLKPNIIQKYHITDDETNGGQTKRRLPTLLGLCTLQIGIDQSNVYALRVALACFEASCVT